ncbi:MAG: cell division protein [Actinobacteria bacterium HGW-Actinobacteria-5]|nr:MAG: cell division protein [Actinobacteria bacterium HGW-Actinobacteria-5]
MSDVVGYRKRRGVEAFMLAFAIILGMGGYLLTHLNRDAALPPEWPWALAALLTIGVALHAVIRWRLPYADPLILPLVMLLNGIGLAMIHRLDLGTSPRMHSAELQLMWTAIAAVACCLVIAFLRDYRVLQRYTYTMFLAGMALLMLPLVPGLGTEKNGARIWIHLGPYSFQPAELAKLVLSIAFASYLVEKRDVLALAGGRFLGIELPRPRDLGPILLMWLASLAVLVFQKDLGTSLLFFGLFVMMLYVATEKPSWAILGLLLFATGAYLGYLFFSHVQVRVSSWLNPFSNYDQNYQVIQGQFGIAWGGALGTGWGLGRPNLTPLAKTDFIAAAIGEELGVAGLTAVMLIYGLIVARGLRASLVARDPFGKLLAAGLSFVFAIQVFAILGGVTRLLPLTGLTTPFMSQGGSSLVANWVMVGLLLVITHQVRSPVAEVPAEPEQWLAAEATQVVPVGASVDAAAGSPRSVPATSPAAIADDAPVPVTPPADDVTVPVALPADDVTTEVTSGPGGGAGDPSGGEGDDPTTEVRLPPEDGGVL